MKHKKHIIRLIFMFVMVVGIFVPLEGKAEETENLTIHMEGKRDYDFAYKVFELVRKTLF